MLHKYHELEETGVLGISKRLRDQHIQQDIHKNHC